MSEPSLIQQMIQSGNYQLFFDAIKAFRNGFVYGVKVRAPHTLVMSMLWSRGTPAQMALKIVKASKQHGLNLGLTAAVFKIAQALLRYALRVVRGSGGGAPTAEVPVWVTFVCGALAGGLFWGDQNPINSQVTMYLISRVLSGLLFAAVAKYQVALPPSSFRALAGLMWGLVLVLFMHQPSTLQASLQTSMGYIYKESGTYSSFWDLVVVNSPTTF